MSNPTPEVPTTPPTPATPDEGIPGPVQDDYLASRDHELTGRERILLAALLPSGLLMGLVNSVMLWLLPETVYGFWSIQSLVCYGLATFLLVLWFYVKWRYVWSVRKAHHLSFYVKRGIEAVAAVAVVILASYLLGFRYYATADVTVDQKLSLSPKSQNILDGLPDGSRIEMYLPYDEANLYRMSELERLALERNRKAVSRICQAIQTEAGAKTKASIQFKAIDIHKQADEAMEVAELMARMLPNMPTSPATGKPYLPPDLMDDLVIVYFPPPPKASQAPEPPRFFYVDKNKFYQRGKPDRYGKMQGTVFVGESRVMATIERLRTNNPVKMFLVGDHRLRGRALPDTRGAAAGIFQTNNLQLVQFELKSTQTIPTDADFVVLLNIEQPLSPAECETLYNYVVDGGSLLVCVDPQSETGKNSGIEPFLEKFGLVVRQDQDIHTTVDGTAIFPKARGVVPSLYQEEELPPNFEWLRRFSSFFASKSGSSDPVELRGACYLETPRAISDKALNDQHAKFYELLTTDRRTQGVGSVDLWATAQTPGMSDGRPGPYTLGGVVQMYLEYPPDKPHINAATGQKVGGKYHHVFIMTDSDWLFAEDLMARDSNQRFLDLIVQKLVGVELVQDTSDSAINFIQTDPHPELVATVTGFLPAIILAIVGYMYLSARRQVPREAA